MGISVWQLLIILAIVLLLFGAKRLRNIGSDLGAAVRGFRQSVKEGGNGEAEKLKDSSEARVIEGEANAEAVEKEKA